MLWDGSGSLGTTALFVYSVTGIPGDWFSGLSLGLELLGSVGGETDVL